MANITDKADQKMNNEHSTESELDARIQALPQELQDQIMWLTDAFEIPAVVRITEKRVRPVGTIGRQYRRAVFRKCHRPPVALQLNQNLRAQFAQAYYSTALFECLTNPNWTNYYKSAKGCYWRRQPNLLEGSGTVIFLSWLHSLERVHKAMIGTLQVTEVSNCSIDEVDFMMEAKAMKRSVLEAGEGCLGKSKLLLCGDVFIDGFDHKELKFDVNEGRMMMGNRGGSELP